MVRVEHHSMPDDHSDVYQCYNHIIRIVDQRKTTGERTSKRHYTNLSSGVATRVIVSPGRRKMHNTVRNQFAHPQEQHKGYHRSEHIVSYSSYCHTIRLFVYVEVILAAHL